MKNITPAAEQLGELEQALRRIQAPIRLPFILTQGQQDWLAHEQTCLIVAAHWVVRNRLGLWSRRQHPFTSPLFRNREPWAKYLTELLSLCIACDDASESSPYRSPFEHWSYCVTEDRVQAVSNFFDGNKSKQNLERECRRSLRSLKNFINPWTSDIHYGRLFDIACPMAEKTYRRNQKDNFYASFYAPFLASFKGYLDDPLTNAAGLLVDRGKSMGLKKGQGSHILAVKMEPVEYIKTISLTQ